MTNENTPNEELEMMEEDSDIIMLTDEEGVETPFQYLTTIDEGGESYVLLQVLNEDESDEEDGEVVILKIEQDENGEDIYVSFDDEELSQKVFDKFLKMLDEEEGEE